MVTGIVIFLNRMGMSFIFPRDTAWLLPDVIKFRLVGSSIPHPNLSSAFLAMMHPPAPESMMASKGIDSMVHVAMAEAFLVSSSSLISSADGWAWLISITLNPGFVSLSPSLIWVLMAGLSSTA